MKSDIEIAASVPLRPITEIARAADIPEEALELYGRYKAKLTVPRDPRKIARSKLILVTAITPNKAGVGKTMTSVSLGLGLTKIVKRAIVALREPSLGPCFGMKGGATGGGYAQVLPMEEINLHFTGDFHAVTSANNMLAALVDNYAYYNRGTDRALKEIVWRRVLDVNDRALRKIVTGLGGPTHGVPMETGFDITPASEIMAVLCLATDLTDLRRRLDNIIVGYLLDDTPVFVRDLGVGGSLVVLLKEAFKPNLVQTTEGTPSIIHGGPFANIAHGCNSIVATNVAMQFGDFVVTEAGFGSDLGAEKFFNIKCRTAGIAPALSVLVVTTQALKMHGGVEERAIREPSAAGIQAGLRNVARHVAALKTFGPPVLVALNRFSFDREGEIELVRGWCEERCIPFCVHEGFDKGGEGARAMAEAVLSLTASAQQMKLNYTYDCDDPIEEKLRKIVTIIYGGSGVRFTKSAEGALKRINSLGLASLPVCVAKTQYSFSDDPMGYGVVTDFEITIQNLVIQNGAQFIVAIAGDIMRMPGLPKKPQALTIDFVEGKTVGLS